VLLKSKMQELESLEGQLAEYKESGATEGETEEYLVEQVIPSPPASAINTSVRPSLSDRYTLSTFPKRLNTHSSVQIAELKAEIAGIEEENAAKRIQLMEENDSARARGRGWREEEEEEVELSFDDSSVKRYECESVRLRVAMADLSKGVGGLAPIEDATYVDGNLKRIYSISFRPCGKLVAAAGHGGMAGIFGIGHGGGGAGGEDVLLSWKAHQGWIGDIQFVSQQKEDASSNLVLSTSNDKMVVLWDINTAASAGRQVIPKKVASASWHSSGVFSMHEVGGSIVTGSKDGAVVVAKVCSIARAFARSLACSLALSLARARLQAVVVSPSECVSCVCLSESKCVFVLL
jgi:WD40 repeat protein